VTLQTGVRLGPYEILDHIGSGGMGEVYRSTDTRLQRSVAIKILPDSFAGDPGRRQRFEREAHVIASLSHPHICALHDVGSAQPPGAAQPVEYLVMEYLEGETLAERLARGPLPIDDIIRYGSEIASALETAHRQRIVHRDLKPANVMLTRSGVKLLDFGLAKAVGAQPAGQSAASTMEGTTSPGTMLGTLPYMSPEQVEGREADARSDIFAFGTVLHEMATGRRAFAANSAAGIASAILASEPPPIASSPALDRIVRACLRKDPDQRWQSAQDVALQLREVPERDRATLHDRPNRVPWIVAAAATVIAIVAGAVAWRARTPSASVDQSASGIPVRFAVPVGSANAYLALSVERPTFAVSPDGRQIAFAGGIGDATPAISVRAAAIGDARPSILVRAVSSESLVALAGTEGAASVFWSPDGKSIGFFAHGKLKRVDVAGGAPVALCDVQQGIGLSGTWGDGQILFASVQGDHVWRVPASGGTPVAVLGPDAARGEQRIVWPSFLPDGRRFLFLSIRAEADKGVVTLAGPDGSRRDVLPVRSNAEYIPPGYLVYGNDGALLAQRFNVETGDLSGQPVAIADETAEFLTTGLTRFSASRNGTIVYHAGIDQSRIIEIDRSGTVVSELRPPGRYQGLRLSPDGRDLYVDRAEPKTTTLDIWKIELDRGSESRVTSAPGSEINAVVAPDGSLIYSAASGGAPRVYRRSTSGAEEQLAPALPGLQIDADVSFDGKWVMYSQRAARGNFDLVAVSLADHAIVPFHQSDADESAARFSPDGQYVAFTSDLGGRRDVYIAPFPGPGPMRIVSTAPASTARWSADGRELYYLGIDGSIYAVPIRTKPALEIGRPQQLFSRGPRARWTSYDLTRDGRFIALEPVTFAAEQPLHVILNWPALAFPSAR
jgi:eukaryotic-like serine/threonine-protein kinase